PEPGTAIFSALGGNTSNEVSAHRPSRNLRAPCSVPVPLSISVVEIGLLRGPPVHPTMVDAARPDTTSIATTAMVCFISLIFAPRQDAGSEDPTLRKAVLAQPEPMTPSSGVLCRFGILATSSAQLTPAALQG